jgi:tetratricopeptide (TPR) repeat protein
VSTSPSRLGSSPSSASSCLIKSCIVLFYISTLGAPSPRAAGATGPPRFPSASPTVEGTAQSSAPGAEADRLYADRATIANARRAADIWRSELEAGGSDAFTAAWKLARDDYWLGGHATAAEQRAFYEQGIEAGRKASALQPDRPEGYFWMGANMGALAESFGLRQGIKYRKPIKEALETVLRLDPAFQQGSADRALGRWYFKVPHLFGGSHKLSEEHLKNSLKYSPQSSASHFFLAELYLDDDRKADARAELQKVLDSPLDPEWTPEDAEFKEKARKLLATLK